MIVTAEQVMPRRSPRYATLATLSTLALLLLAAFLFWLSGRARETEALREIPVAQRRELFEATRRALQTACKPDSRPLGLERYCREQASFLRRFDECDATCRDLIERSQPQPTR